MIGRKIKSTGVGEIAEGQSLEKASINADSVKAGFVHQVQDQVFHEKSLQEFRDEETYFFDVKSGVGTWRREAANLITSIPLLLLLTAGLFAAEEMHASMNNAYLLEMQELQSLEHHKNDILSDRYHR